MARPSKRSQTSVREKQIAQVLRDQGQPVPKIAKKVGRTRAGCTRTRKGQPKATTSLFFLLFRR